jgi:membrane protein
MIEVIRKTFTEWNKDKVPQLAAAIAFYTIFSIPPFLIIALAVARFFYNADTARNQLIAQLGGFVDPQTAGFIQSLLENTNRSPYGLSASLISLVVLLAGASGIFFQLQDALNTIWGIPRKENHRIQQMLKNRLRSFLMVLATGGLLLIFLLLSEVVSMVTGFTYGDTQKTLWPEVINFSVLFVTITLLFAMLYRFIPYKEVSWWDIWLGAAVTALLFLMGRYAIGYYLTISKLGSTLGAGGSLIVLLIWIYYSAQIFFLGAEFIKVYAKKFGSGKRPKLIPIPADEELPPHLPHPIQ